MPGFSGTGPRGMGPRTGGGRVYCPPGAGPLYDYGPEPIRGVGQGGVPWGGGRGRAWGGGRGGGWAGPPVYGGYPPGTNIPYGGYPYGTYAPYGAPDAQQETEALKNQASLLEQELKRISKRLDELSGQDAGTE